VYLTRKVGCRVERQFLNGDRPVLGGPCKAQVRVISRYCELGVGFGRESKDREDEEEELMQWCE
jgi:hypothetical protein